ncbi:uncharacterized protein PV09_05682 [Verruconis gallopava]|uniref:Rhodopsin domain-containing protein n=1 Tax=Verruconis gallopava TaxID=253628 RepID=A0A0D2A8G9_9PEZI|nr:uncharacterized protein PV09_05682 [Verruconis gallopava]KIW03028.1 hypothetical protein PV09_05682 [Verruconis gallopava]
MSATPSSTIVALVPAPSGYHVDFEHPQRRGIPAAYWVTGVGLVISTMFLAMRLYTKIRIVREFKAEDLLNYRQVHIWEESIAQYNEFSVMVIASASLYLICQGLAKFSLLLFYYRMSRLRWFITLSIITMVVVVGYNVATILALIFACNPIAKAWNATITEGSCVNRGALYLSVAISNISTDMILLVMPIPLVWRLQMPRAQKFGLVFIFVIGSMTFITSIVRLVLLLPTLTTVDQPWAIALPGMWVAIEANLIIVCCSFPALRVFARHFVPKWIGEYGSNRSRPTYNAQSGTKSNPTQFASKLQDKMRSRSSYGRMDFSETNTDVELQGNSPKVWSECHRVSRDATLDNVSYLEDVTPPSTGHEGGHVSPTRGIVVTKTFG